MGDSVLICARLNVLVGTRLYILVSGVPDALLGMNIGVLVGAELSIFLGTGRGVDIYMVLGLGVLVVLLGSMNVLVQGLQYYQT